MPIMGSTDRTPYERNLRHCVRPDRPSEREHADRMTLSDYEALYLAERLFEYANYHAEAARETDLATAYHDYINRMVREEKRGLVHVYAHTEFARNLLFEVIHLPEPKQERLHGELVDSFKEMDERWDDVDT